MNVVYVAPFGLGQKTTVWARILPLAKVVANHGEGQETNRVTILIPPWDSRDDEGKIWTEDGVDIVHVSLWGGLPFVILRLLRSLSQLRPNIVHVVKPRAYAGIIQWILWQYRRLRPNASPKIVLDIDDWEQAWNEISGHGPLLSRFLTWQEEWGIRHADGISAASLWLTERAKNYSPAVPNLYLPNGVDLPQVRPLAVDSPLTADNPAAQASQSGGESQATSIKQILYLTRYVEVSSIWLSCFWQALSSKRAQSGVEKLELIIAGGALQQGRDEMFRRQFEASLISLRRETQTDTRKDACKDEREDVGVSWLGLVDTETIDALYQKATCAIFPADEVPLQQAKCSVRLATTLLSGLPVVASNVGQQGEYGGNGAAHLVPADALPEDFAAAVLHVLTDSTERELIRQKAHSHLVERFNWQNLGTQLHTFYRHILEE